MDKKMSNFQDFLLERGWKCFIEINSKKKYIPFNHNVSSYGPLGYFFEHKDYPEIQLYWGLRLKNRGPQWRAFPCKVELKKENTFEKESDVWAQFMMNNDNETILDYYINKRTINE